MDVLLSIKPKYVDKIITGEKKYEFRKTRLNKEKIENVYVYSTSPVKKITIRFTIKDIIEGSPQSIWDKCSEYSGTLKDEFFNYFTGKEKAFAIEIKEVEQLDNPIDPYLEIGNFTPPQSYYYLKKHILDLI